MRLHRPGIALALALLLSALSWPSLLPPCSAAYGESGDGPDGDGAEAAAEDPLVSYSRGAGAGTGAQGEDGWETPFMRPLRIDPVALAAKCAALAPGFDPLVVQERDASPPVTSMAQLRAIARGEGPPGQKVLVVAPRFGLGNTLRNWVSAFFFGLFSGRRVVLLHGGKYHGVYTSLCLAFACAFDHVMPEDDPPPPPPGPLPRGKQRRGRHGPHAAAEALLEELEHSLPHRQVSQKVAREALLWEDPVLFSFSYAFWDHWWLNNRTLAACGCRAIGGCKWGGGVRSKALHALIAGGPSKDLGDTIEAVLRRHQPRLEHLLLLPRVPGVPDAGEGAGEEQQLQLDPGALRVAELALQSPALSPAASGVAMQFDVGFHIRTRTSILENPNRPFGNCRTQAECQAKRDQELDTHRRRFLGRDTWQCIGLFLRVVAAVHGPERVRPLSIFLATDNQALRPQFVRRLSRYGVVYYNGAEVAHVGVSGGGDRGRLPTMAEWYLLGKSHIVVELDSYLSTFSYFSGLMGNGTIVTLPYVVKDLQRCARVKPVQKGLWRKGDPRASTNAFFAVRS